jgi:hypothetical protein
MNADEKAIMDYLKACRHGFVSGREIARRAGGKRRFEEDNCWAIRVLRIMVTKGWLETDPAGHFRIPAEDAGGKKKALRRHLSPQLRRILEQSGKNFEGIVIDEDEP